jgi:hypothetical protein
MGKWSPKERRERAKKCDNPKGFTMKQFCKNLKSKSKKGERSNNVSSPKRKNSPRKKEFLFNKENPKKSFDVYIDKNPNDTIPMKYKTLSDVKSTIRKLEKLYKEDKYPHRRIKQVAMIMMVRLRVLKDQKPKEYQLSERYHTFLGERTKVKNTEDRKKMKFRL